MRVSSTTRSVIVFLSDVSVIDAHVRCQRVVSHFLSPVGFGNRTLFRSRLVPHREILLEVALATSIIAIRVPYSCHGVFFTFGVNDGTPVVDSGKIGDARSKVSDVPRYQVSTYTGGDPR